MSMASSYSILKLTKPRLKFRLEVDILDFRVLKDLNVVELA